jgi:hypothetical protein
LSVPLQLRVIQLPVHDAGTAVTGSAAGAGDATPPPTSDDLTWVAIQLAGDPVAYTGLAYELTTSDGNVHSGTLDASGLVRVDGIPPGLCTLRFPDKADGDVLQASGTS